MDSHLEKQKSDACKDSNQSQVPKAVRTHSEILRALLHSCLCSENEMVVFTPSFMPLFRDVEWDQRL
jgi:hypothetical protein